MTYTPSIVLAICAALLAASAIAAPSDGAWVASIVLSSMTASAAGILAAETALARRRARRDLGSLPDSSLRHLNRQDHR